MPRFAANLSMMFKDFPLAERVGPAAKAGFPGVEIQFPYEVPAEKLAEQLRTHGLELALINTPPGNMQAGERGLGAVPGREADFLANLETAIAYAQTTGTKRIHVMAGTSDAPAEDRERTFRSNLAEAAKLLSAAGITGFLEPINTRDIPGYHLNYQAQAVETLDAVGSHALSLQMDFYHLQIMEGDLAKTFQKYKDRVGYIQIAGVPERHEPDIGEINHPYLFDLLDAEGYNGWVGAEYHPRGDTLAGLGWATRYGIG